MENIRDVIAIEQTGQFNGLYHVLGGIISPVDGIGPESLTIDNLVHRCKEDGIREVIMGISLPTFPYRPAAGLRDEAWRLIDVTSAARHNGLLEMQTGRAA